MNPQYMQQHPPYGPPVSNSSYQELNANLPPKGLPDLQSSLQKLPIGPPIAGHNTPLPPKSPYYMNDIQEKSNVPHGLPYQQQLNQNNLVNPLSAMTLASSPLQPVPSIEKSAPLMPSLPAMNGLNNQNHYPPPENGPPITKPSLQRPGGPNFLSSQGSMIAPQYSGQPLPPASITQGANISKSTPPSISPVNLHNSVQNKTDSLEKSPGKLLNTQLPYSRPPTASPTAPILSPSTNGSTGSLSGLPLSTAPASIISPTNGPPRDLISGPVSGSSTNQVYSLPTQPISNSGPLFNGKYSSSQAGSNNFKSISQSTTPVNDHNLIHNQKQPENTLLNQANFHGGPPSMPLNSQQSFRGPPSSSQPPLGPPPQNFSGSLPLNRSNLSGIPPPASQNYQSTNQQSLSRPSTLEPSPSNLSGPLVSGQHHNFSGPYGQQSMSGPLASSGQQISQPQYLHSNQIPEQRRFSPNPSLASHQQNTINSHNHLGQQSDMSYSQGYLQNYGQNNYYANQASPYNSGVTSPVGGYQSPSQSQAKRLDPEQMPSPIQVIQDDQRTKGGVFVTNQKGLVPPLVTTKFTVEDQGNASPRFIRSSMYTVPTTIDIIKQTQVPFSLILSPMAQVEEGEFEPPVVNMGELGPVRCHRCKAYMSPFMQFLDAGRRFQCMFCKATTEVPSEYFQHLDHTGQRLDRYERPELMLGTYEFIATKDYCRNNSFPKPPAIIFIIDVSYNTIKSGLINLLCGQMKKIINNLPVDVGKTKSEMKVGFITYNNTVHFYNLNPSLAQPQMMVVGDVQDVFMPLLDGFLCDPEESESLIDSLMAQIPTMFGNTRETEIILAPAIQAGLEALKASECTGKLMVFHSSLPTADAPGKLKNRDDRKFLGTDKEKSVLAPQTNFYNNLGQDCVGSGCSVDLFIFNNSYTDIATIGQICRLTGGELYKYTYFQAELDGERLITDIMNNLSRPVAYDAVMRVRTSTGVRPVDFYGHFYMSNTTDIELASIDSDKAIAVEIKHDDKLTEEDTVYIQAALLYTSCSGVRRLRIMNLSLKTSSQMSELYRACDLDVIINYLSKQSVFKVIEQSSKVIKENLHARCAAILASYRKHCASPSSAGQLILPECMKLLPLYINGLVKSDAISGGGGITVDQKSFVMMTVATMPISESIVHVYPRLLPLHQVDIQNSEIPFMLRCSIDKFTDDGAYLIENGMHMFLWLGSNLSSQWVQSVFGVSSTAHVDTERASIPQLDNPLNKRIRTVINHVQSERRYCMRLTLTKQRDKMEMVMRQFLVEDRGADSSPGYVDFLCHMHREIRTLLS